MTHVDPLSPTIFNVVVYAVVLHWKSLAAERAGGDSRNNNTAKPAGRMIRESDKRQRRTEEGHTRLKVKEYFFHAEGGMVASTDPGWLHSALNMPTLLFDQLGLKTNSRKPWGWCAIHAGRPGYGQAKPISGG